MTTMYRKCYVYTNIKINCENTLKWQYRQYYIEDKQTTDILISLQ